MSQEESNSSTPASSSLDLSSDASLTSVSNDIITSMAHGLSSQVSPSRISASDTNECMMLTNNNMIMLQANTRPVIACGGIKLTPQDLQQIQHQLQQRLLNQSATLVQPQVPPQACTPGSQNFPQSYVILGPAQPLLIQTPQGLMPLTTLPHSSIPSIPPSNDNLSGVDLQSIATNQHVLVPTPASQGSSQQTSQSNTATSQEQSPVHINLQATPASNHLQASVAVVAPVASNVPAITMHQNQNDELIDLEELEKFANYFKHKRVELGYTQGDVGQAIGKYYNDFSQTTISRFEALNLSFKNMCALKQHIQKWLDEVEKRHQNLESNTTAIDSPELNCITSSFPAIASAGSPPTPPSSRKRKRRTTIDNETKQTLEEYFITNRKPTTDEIQKLADQFDLQREVIRVWFCNRRQKAKRLNPAGQSLAPSIGYVQNMNSAPMVLTGSVGPEPTPDRSIQSGRVLHNVLLPDTTSAAVTFMGTTTTASLPQNLTIINQNIQTHPENHFVTIVPK